MACKYSSLPAKAIVPGSPADTERRAQQARTVAEKTLVALSSSADPIARPGRAAATQAGA